MLRQVPSFSRGSIRRCFVMGIIVMITICSSGIVSASHPFHATLAEMEWNEAHKRFEVCLQLPGPEIEDELSTLHGRRINLETTPDGESLLQKYIEQHFRIADANHSSCRIRWVGLEVEIRSVWVYFEVELAKDDSLAVPAEKGDASDDVKDLKVQCTIMTSRANQVNLVNVTKGRSEASIHLTAEQPQAIVEFKKRPLKSGEVPAK